MRYAFFIDLDVVTTPLMLQQLVDNTQGKLVTGKLYNFRPTKHKGFGGMVEKYQFSIELAPKVKSSWFNIQQAIDSVECAMMSDIDCIVLACKQRDCVNVASKIAKYNKSLTLVVADKFDCNFCDNLVCLEEYQEENQEVVAEQKFDFLPYTRMQCEQDLTKLNAQLNELIEQKSAQSRLKKVKNDKIDELTQKYF